MLSNNSVSEWKSNSINQHYVINYTDEKGEKYTDIFIGAEELTVLESMDGITVSKIRPIWKEVGLALIAKKELMDVFDPNHPLLGNDEFIEKLKISFRNTAVSEENKENK